MSSSQLSTFYYADKIARRLICDWKFSFDTECRDELFRQLKTRLGPVKKIVKSQNIETICCVPLHAIKKRMRGFDQAEQLAQLIAQKTHSMYIPLLIRAKTTTSQADKKTADRRQIIDQNPFVINPAFNVPKRVLLVDDVWTTGSTATAAINVLKSAGVEQVIVYTAARG
jgi:ComF family protein